MTDITKTDFPKDVQSNYNN